MKKWIRMALKSIYDGIFFINIHSDHRLSTRIRNVYILINIELKINFPSSADTGHVEKIV